MRNLGWLSLMLSALVACDGSGLEPGQVQRAPDTTIVPDTTEPESSPTVVRVRSVSSMAIPRFPGVSGIRRRSFLSLAAATTSILATVRENRAQAARPVPAVGDGKLRVIVFGAHPDDCELSAGGTTAKWTALGHHVKFVSCTNGDIGHWGAAGGPLARRRAAEVGRCAEILGNHSQVLDIHDGELMVTMENRRLICGLIRDWQADIVISHRPNDYHPDHRYTGVLVMDAAYMVTVPHFCPDVPHLTKNPVFFFAEDEFQKPNPFTPDVVVPLDDVIEKKLAAVEALESQFYEGGCNGGAHLVPNPADSAAVAARKKVVREEWAGYFSATANRFRANLLQQYAKDRAEGTKYAEAFEICEYGRKPGKDELKRLFPFI